MTIGTNNWEEEMATMKAMVEKLTKGSEDKKVHIKLQEEKIARLTRRREKWLTWSFAKSSDSEEVEKAFVQSEVFDEEMNSKKGSEVKNDESTLKMHSKLDCKYSQGTA